MFRRQRAAAFAAAFIVSVATPAAAQHDEHAHHTAMAGMAMPEAPLGIPHTRMGSGTSWLPDTSPMYAWHVMTGRWMLMVHGAAFAQYDRQFGPRGATQFGSINWGMLMAMRPLAGGLLHLHGMLSAEPLTIGARGYPLLLQSGETYQGAPLYDRQHPHDLFMELAAMYERQVARGLGLSLYLAPVGEPAIGPVAYMHRPSAQNDPFATLAHHWQDATHITYGVATAGLFTRTVKLEGSFFNGREPDEDRTDFDFHRLDSWGVRLSANPTPHWALSASYGFLDRPEALRPDESQRRLGAQALYVHPLRHGGTWSSGLIYGANRETGPDVASPRWQHSIVLETDVELDRRNTFFGRVTFVQKNAEQLQVPGIPPERQLDVVSFVAGYAREIGELGGAGLAVGGRGSLNLVPTDLKEAYGTRTPVGVAIYLRLRPTRATH